MQEINEKRDNRKRRFLVIFLLLAVIGWALGSIYAYWAGTVSAPQDKVDTPTVVVGEGKDVTTTIDVTKQLEDKVLVPVGKVSASKGEKAVDEFVVPFKVKWVDAANIVKAEDLVLGTLTVTPKVTLMGNDGQDHGSLITAVVQNTPLNDIKLNDSGEMTVNVKLTMAEPQDKAEYDAVFGKTISMETTFNVTKN